MNLWSALYGALAGFGLLCGVFAVAVGLTVGIAPWAWPLAVFGLISSGVILILQSKPHE